MNLNRFRHVCVVCLFFFFLWKKGKHKGKGPLSSAQTQEDVPEGFLNDFADCWSEKHEQMWLATKIGKCLVGGRDTKKKKEGKTGKEANA